MIKISDAWQKKGNEIIKSNFVSAGENMIFLVIVSVFSQFLVFVSHLKLLFLLFLRPPGEQIFLSDKRIL